MTNLEMDSDGCLKITQDLAAYHEAGHAVAAAHVNRIVANLTITPPSEATPNAWSGETSVYKYRFDFGNELIISQGGRAVTEKLAGHRNFCPCGHDWGGKSDMRAAKDVAFMSLMANKRPEGCNGMEDEARLKDASNAMIETALSSCRLLFDDPKVWCIVEKVAARVKMAEGNTLEQDELTRLLSDVPRHP